MRRWTIAGAAFVAIVSAATGPVSAASTPRPHAVPGSDHVAVCGPQVPGIASCTAIRLLDPFANWHGAHLPDAPPVSPAKGGGSHGGHGGGGGGATTPSGYSPADLQTAFELTGSNGPSAIGGTGETVALVDAHDDSKAAADLVAYRSQFNLRTISVAPSCSSSRPCFTKIDQAGGTSYSTAGTSWSQEISLDLVMVSVTCPNCNILLVEASSATLSDVGTAASYATAHANAASNSYGSKELSSETSYDRYYGHAGVAITVSAGDSGHGAEYPAASPHVVAVGGTTLTRATATSRGWTETVWSGTGSGCSAALDKVTSGTNARHCANFLRNAADSLSTGYNGPAGNGTPARVAGFWARQRSGMTGEITQHEGIPLTQRRRASRHGRRGPLSDLPISRHRAGPHCSGSAKRSS